MPSVTSGYICCGERRAYSQRHQEAINHIRRDGNRSLNRVREKVGEGERLGGVAGKLGRFGGAEVGVRGLEEAEVNPGGEEAEEGEEHGDGRVEEGPGDEVDEKEEGGEVLRGGLVMVCDAGFIGVGTHLYPDLDDAFEERDGVFRDKLLERHKVSCLECYSAADRYEPTVTVLLESCSDITNPHSAPLRPADTKWVTYAKAVLPVPTNHKLNSVNATKFGTTLTTNRNFPNSLDPHALSKYFPP